MSDAFDPVPIRPGRPDDDDALGKIFFEAVRYGATHYSEAEREVWLPEPPTGPEWSERLRKQTIMVAEAAEGPVGFMTLYPHGEIDLAFILTTFRGRGLFRQLYTPLENQARQTGLDRLFTYASLHARGPFEAVGFTVIEAQTIERRGESLRRFYMEKRL